MLEQSSTGRTYTRDANAPVRRNVHAEVVKLTGGSSAFPFSNLEESVLTEVLGNRNQELGTR